MKKDPESSLKQSANNGHTYKLHRLKFFEYTPQAINCIAYNQRGDLLALSRCNGTIELWKLEPGNCDLFYLTTILTEHGTSIEALVWHSDTLIRAGLDGDLVEYDMYTLTPKNIASSHAGAIWCMTVDSTQSYIAAGTEEGCVVIFQNTTEGFKYLKSLQKQDERMLSIDWHSEGDVIVTGGIDNIRLWCFSTGQVQQRITIARLSPEKPSIVWAVLILKDKTVVSGDSRGKVSFWNGKQGTQIKMFSCHRADILSLCVNSTHTEVFAAGIDPTLIQFVLSPIASSSDWNVWHRSAVRMHHSHDVRSLAYCKGNVISGGVDCSLVAINVEKHLRFKSVPIEQLPLVQLATDSRLIMMQYPTYLQLWSLGESSSFTSNSGHGLSLAIDTPHACLLELRSRNDELIMCSAVSSNASWIAYADRNCLRLFSLKVVRGNSSLPEVQTERMKNLPHMLSTLPIRCMSLSDSALLLGYVDGSIRCLYLQSSNNSLPSIGSTIISYLTKERNVQNLLRLLVTSHNGKMIATCCQESNVTIYQLESNSIDVVCQLPLKEVLITAMTFSPDNSKLAVACYSKSLKVMEFDIAKKKFTATTLSKETPANSKHSGSSSKVISMKYANSNNNVILLHDFLGVKAYITHTGQLSTCRNLCEYRYLMYFNEVDEDTAVIVERNPFTISSTLPQPLGKKQFGT